MFSMNETDCGWFFYWKFTWYHAMFGLEAIREFGGMIFEYKIGEIFD